MSYTKTTETWWRNKWYEADGLYVEALSFSFMHKTKTWKFWSWLITCPRKYIHNLKAFDLFINQIAENPTA